MILNEGWKDCSYCEIPRFYDLVTIMDLILEIAIDFVINKFIYEKYSWEKNVIYFPL